MSVKANKKSLKQQGGAMIPEAPGMMEMPQQPQQPKVNPEVMQIAQMIKSSVNEGNELIDIVKGLMQDEVDQQLIGQALMMGGIEEEDIITIFETASTPPQPSAPEEVDREPQLLARNRDIAKKEREQAEQAQSQEQEVDISEQVRTLAKSGIEIKPENEGKFTAWAKKRGMGVQEAARKVLANKGKYPPSIVKMANFARNAAKWKKQEGGEKDKLKKAKDGVDMPAGQYINGVFIPDESEVDKSMLSQNLQRPANFYMSDNHYAVAPLSPPPKTNVLADFISTATGINQDLFSNEVDDYGNRKGALKDVFKRGEGISINNPFKKGEKIQLTQGNPDPDAGSGMSKMEMHRMLKPFYYDTTIDTSQITSPENIKAYTDWAMQQKKQWDSNTQEQLDEQASVVEDVSGQSAEQDNRTFGEWAKDAGHDIVKMSENAVNLLQNLWKKTTGKMGKGGGINNPGFKALPPEAQHNILSNMATGGDKASRKDVKEYSNTWDISKGDTRTILNELINKGANLDTDTIISNFQSSQPMGDQRFGQRMYNLSRNVNASNLLPYMDSNSGNFAGNLGATFPFVDGMGYGAFLGVPKNEKGGENSYLENRDKVIKRAIARQEGKAQEGGEETPEMIEYLKALEFNRKARQAVGTNDKELLASFTSRMNPDTPYGERELARDFSDLQQLRQAAGLGLMEEASILFPHVGQQLRGGFNQILGTNFEEGGEKGEAAYLANRDRVIKREMAKAQEGIEQNYPMGPFQETNPYQTYPYITEDESLMNEDEVIDMDNDKIPDYIDVDGGDGTGEAALGTINNPSANQLFEKINFEPEVNVSNKVEGTVNRLADNPVVGAFASLSDAAVKTARFVNDRFDEKAYRDALDQMEERSGADYKFAVKTSDPMSQGFYDANTGQLQGEAERTAGYYGSFAASPYSFGTAQDGVEIKPTPEKKEFDYSNMSAEQIMFIQQFLDRERESNGPTNTQLFPNDSTNINRPVTDGLMGRQTFTKPPKETGGEIVELSQDMIAQLIAAGADIEII